MDLKNLIRVTLIVTLTIGGAASATPQEKALDTAKIETVIGAKGVMNEEEGVFKVSFPRDDVKITVNGTAMPPFMGLTSWAAFRACRR